MATSGVEDVTVLHVDDDPDLRDLAKIYLERAQPEIAVETAPSADSALDRIDSAAPIDCVVSDYQMPEMNGLELLGAVRERRPDIPFILFTGKGSEEIASDAISAGVTDYLQKEASNEQYTVLANRIENAVSQRRAQRAVERTTERYQTLIRESTDVIAVVEADGTFRSVSSAVERIFGYTPKDLVGDPVFEHIHPADVDRVADAFADLIDDPANVPVVEFRLERPDGDWTHVEVEGRNLLDDPVVDGIVAYARDVSDRVERQTELERYEQIVEIAGDGAYVLDEDGHYVMVNQKTVERTGYSREELIGTDGSIVFDESDAETARQAMVDVFRSEEQDYAQFEATVHARDGTAYPVEIRAAPIVDDDRIVGAVGTSRDIAERKARELELERQNKRLGNFASVVSHDLRNPLNVAQARTELVRESHDNEHLDVVADPKRRMERLIDDLLTLAREEETVEETVTVDLEAVSSEAWAAVPTAAASLSVEADRPVEAARSRLRQALENLFRNAIEHGGSDVAVTVGGLEAGGFYVADDGDGVAEADVDRLFEPEYSTKDDGTGLGLSIVREIIQAHGWTIEYVAPSGSGARFEVHTDPPVEPVADG